MSAWRVLSIGVACAALCSIVSAQPVDRRLELAKQYVELRSGLFMSDWRTVTQQGMNAPQLDEMAVEIVGGLKQSPSWNSAHPAWTRVVAVVRKDLGLFIATVNNDARVVAINDQILTAIARGLAKELSAADLESLSGFYGTPQGRRFNEIQRKMLALTGGALADGPQHSRPEQTGIDPSRFASVFGPVDEGIRWMAHAVGDLFGKGEDGYRLLLNGITAVVRQRFRELETIWLELPDDARSAVFVHRESPLGIRERSALLDAGRALPPAAKMAPEIERLLDMLQAKEKEWRALVPD